jgi:serine protease AprX
MGQNKQVTKIETQYLTAIAEIDMLKIDKMHAMGLTGNGVTIAVIDTGFDKEHSVFTKLKVVDEYDFVRGDNNTQSNGQDNAGEQDHGTFVLSILAAWSPGILVGIAHESSYLLAKTERPDIETTQEEDWFIEGLEWAEEKGADIVTASLGFKSW